MRVPGLSAVMVLAAASATIPGDDMPTEQDVVSGAVNAAYELAGERVKLRSGMLKRLPDSPRVTQLITTSMWGAPAIGDLNGDGRQDAALILLHEPGGSRALYYVAACVSRRYHRQCKGTRAVLLGDRISPQLILIRERAIIINYAGRVAGDSLDLPPNVSRTRRLGLYHGELGKK